MELSSQYQDGPCTDSHEENSVYCHRSGRKTDSQQPLGRHPSCVIFYLLVLPVYDNDSYSQAQYVIFRDIMVMLLLGFPHDIPGQVLVGRRWSYRDSDCPCGPTQYLHGSVLTICRQWIGEFSFTAFVIVPYLKRV